MKYLFGNLNVLNVVLAAVLIIFLKYMALPLFGIKPQQTLAPAVKKTSVEASKPEKDKQEEKSPSFSDFMIIAEQNLFHPDRIIPVPKVEAPPLPKPEFVLFGTLVTDTLQLAYMDDKKSEDKKNKAAGQVKKQTAVRLGEMLSGFILREVRKDQVVMQRGDEVITVSLNETKTREVPTTTAAAPGAHPGEGTPVAAASPPPGQPGQPRPPVVAPGGRGGSPAPTESAQQARIRRRRMPTGGVQ